MNNDESSSKIGRKVSFGQNLIPWDRGNRWCRLKLVLFWYNKGSMVVCNFGLEEGSQRISSYIKGTSCRERCYGHENGIVTRRSMIAGTTSLQKS
mmetsp:Transcript_19805/g.55207  ORF Transcript_19805/g.55207 Transcript_19805/m.55207 type:complete len:95 (+) Transcript_19805:526-810(+)